MGSTSCAIIVPSQPWVQDSTGDTLDEAVIHGPEWQKPETMLIETIFGLQQESHGIACVPLTLSPTLYQLSRGRSLEISGSPQEQ
eukprot:1463206-Amphidinium_carterae.1